MKIRRKLNKDMKKFSKNLNNVFEVLNSLTGSKVFESSVFNWDGDDCLHIKVCGRDSVWTKDFECIDHGMQIGNPFLSALKGIKPTITSPLYSHLLTEK